MIGKKGNKHYFKILKIIENTKDINLSIVKVIKYCQRITKSSDNHILYFDDVNYKLNFYRVEDRYFLNQCSVFDLNNELNIIVIRDNIINSLIKD